MRFSLYRTRDINIKFAIFAVAMMQFIVSMGTEILNMIVICQETNPKNIIINILAFGIISGLDEAIFLTQHNNLSKDLL